MKTIIALYRGGTVASAELVAVSADPEIIAEVTRRLLGEDRAPEDPVAGSLAHGRRSALQVIHREAVGGLRRRGRFSIVPPDHSAPDGKGGGETDRPADADDTVPGGES